MSTVMSQFQQLFFEEATEHLESMERLLLALDVASPDRNALDAIFRAAHSIKGGAGTFGFNDLTEVTHVLETLLDRIRKNEIAIRAPMVDVFLQAGDLLREQLNAHQGEEAVDPERLGSTVAALHALAQADVPAAAGQPDAPASQAAFLHTITFHPAHADAELAESLRQELANLGPASLIEESPDDAAVCYVFSLSAAADLSAIHEIFAYIAHADEFSIRSQPLPEAADPGAENAYGFFDDAPGIPAAQSAIEDEDFGFFAPLPPPADTSGTSPDEGFGFFEPLPAVSAAVAPVLTGAGVRPPADSRSGARAVDHAAAESSIRVGVEKVDQLINLVGELVITQAMLVETVAQLDPGINERLLNGMTQLERNTRSLQESVMTIRMMPMSFVFGRFPRLVRDLAAKLGKNIELVCEGESTELDKGLIEKIVDPLTHLVRNSLDHGIETSERRIAAGKEGQGRLTLRAGHKGGSILIEVEDNGAGLNRQRILAKAGERGLPVSEAMSDQEVWQLIFAAGFSTADTVTDVSGRGVGMDVVKRNIDALGGRVEISSTAGRGTTVSIQLPLTLAILDGMSVGVGNEVFIIPLAQIAESLQPDAADLRSISGGSGSGQVVHVRGEYLPLVPICRLFNLPPRSVQSGQGILVIVDTGDGRMAFCVDDLLGQHQVVIKSLDANYRKVAGIAGATIMGDGRVALILDVAGIARMARMAGS